MECVCVQQFERTSDLLVVSDAPGRGFRASHAEYLFVRLICNLARVVQTKRNLQPMNNPVNYVSTGNGLGLDAPFVSASSRDRRNSFPQSPTPTTLQSQGKRGRPSSSATTP